MSSLGERLSPRSPPHSSTCLPLPSLPSLLPFSFPPKTYPNSASPSASPDLRALPHLTSALHPLELPDPLSPRSSYSPTPSSPLQQPTITPASSCFGGSLPRPSPPPASDTDYQTQSDSDLIMDHDANVSDTSGHMMPEYHVAFDERMQEIGDKRDRPNTTAYDSDVEGKRIHVDDHDAVSAPTFPSYEEHHSPYPASSSSAPAYPGYEDLSTPERMLVDRKAFSPTHSPRSPPLPLTLSYSPDSPADATRGIRKDYSSPSRSVSVSPRPQHAHLPNSESRSSMVHQGSTVFYAPPSLLRERMFAGGRESPDGRSSESHSPLPRPDSPAFSPRMRHPAPDQPLSSAPPSTTSSQQDYHESPPPTPDRHAAQNQYPPALFSPRVHHQQQYTDMHAAEHGDGVYADGREHDHGQWHGAGVEDKRRSAGQIVDHHGRQHSHPHTLPYMGAPSASSSYHEQTDHDYYSHPRRRSVSAPPTGPMTEYGSLVTVEPPRHSHQPPLHPAAVVHHSGGGIHTALEEDYHQQQQRDEFDLRIQQHVQQRIQEQQRLHEQQQQQQRMHHQQQQQFAPSAPQPVMPSPPQTPQIPTSPYAQQAQPMQNMQQHPKPHLPPPHQHQNHAQHHHQHQHHHHEYPQQHNPPSLQLTFPDNHHHPHQQPTHPRISSLLYGHDPRPQDPAPYHHSTERYSPPRSPGLVIGGEAGGYYDPMHGMGVYDAGGGVYGEGPKVFKCPKLYCSKVGCSSRRARDTYKNANGLKYHLDKGSCELDYTTANDLDAEAAAAGHVKIAHRPYWCKVRGCGKKYKNLNGLKYHAKAAHPEMDFKMDVKGVFQGV
ncbi:hypothetical protein BDK51DRAFT_44306 [Blyttiomyces helicus]|uniref:C2H2-type domain-containing protein n=1 Tax=Blyttiomyces helicus TaxID=388810 RepID=A0A4V1IR58_9FUNG|nr:hypothetical protein BDK51DRAFT_44306 [Blyttiomyces helicus]|eukprot:RKO88907.1 hypothetical protein BDK51DRAFT_44306 [Blyttiomyces helicus]